MNFHSFSSGLDVLAGRQAPKPPNASNSLWLATPRGNVRYVDRGPKNAKFTVILMPDPPNTIEHMESLSGILEQDFRVIAYETLGFGYSRANSKFNFSIEHNADVVQELIDGLNIKKAIVALTCLACFHALKAARNSKEIVGLVLGQAPSKAEALKWAYRVDFKGVIGTPVLGQVALRAGRNKVAELWYKNALPKGADSSEYLSLAKKSFEHGSLFSLASGLQALKRDQTPLAELTAHQDAIVIWGNLDRTHKATPKDSILELLPNGSVTQIENCGHFPDVEVPEVFAKAIRDIAGI